MSQKVMRDVLKAVQQEKVLANPLFTCSPHVFHGILRGSVRSQVCQMNQTLLFRTIPLESLEIGVHEIPAVRGGAIPHDDKAASLERSPSRLEKHHRVFPIARLSRHHERTSREKVDRPIIRLPFPFVEDRDVDPFPARPPDIAQRIPPHQMTFIHTQHHGVLVDNFYRLLRRFFGMVSRVAITCSGSDVGWRGWLFFHEHLTSWRRA